jgi:signal transduction histidine kinase
MRDVIDQVTASILEARKGLEQALTDLEKLPAIDPHSLAFSAHALQNYLTIMSGTTELLSLKLTGYPDPEVQAWMTYMRQATEMMARIVADLMNSATVSRAPALKFDKVNLAKMLRRFSDAYQVKAADKRIQVTYKPEQDTIFVWADAVALAAVLDNLFSNALKYSPLGGEVRVTLWKESAMVVCAVQDQGQGLSREDQSKLFQRGVKLSSVPTGGEPSSGYGLAVAKELTTLMQGEIWCDSELGKGARFLLRLPEYHDTNETNSDHLNAPAR